MNKVAFITGATTGIGKEIALSLADIGYNIVINYRHDNENLQLVKHELEEKNVEVLCVKGDVAIFEDTQKMTKEAISKFGRIDVLVNNAGITKDSLLLRMSEEDFTSVINTNLNGAFNMVKNIVPYMMKQKEGRVINLSSVVGIMGNAGQINYASSKAGIIGLTKSLAKEVGSRNILVNAIAPGYIKTNMTEVLTDDIKNQIASNIPLKRLGTPKDIAGLVKFLVSDDSSYITGQVIHVDGGMVM